MAKLWLLIAAAGLVGLAVVSCGENPSEPVRENALDRWNPVTGGIGNTSLVINGGDIGTNNRLVNLTLTAPNATRMMISNASSFAQGQWRSFAANVNGWEIGQGDGEHRIYVQFGNETVLGVGATSASIILDQTPPVVAGMMPTPSDGAPDVPNPVTLSWTPATDAHSGVAGYRVLLGTVNPPTTQIYSGSATTCVTGVLDVETAYYWLVVAVDHAGNEAHRENAWSFTTTSFSLDLQGLVSYWKMDENYSAGQTNFVDSHGSNNGIATNARVRGGAGKINNCADFSRGNDGINVSNTMFDNRSAASFSGWIKISAIKNDNFFWSSWLTLGGRVRLSFGLGDTNTLRLSARSRSNDTRQDLHSETVLSVNTWYFVVAVVDLPSNTMKLFIDGILDCMRTDAVWGQTTFASGSSGNGHNLGYSYNVYFNGYLDEVGMWTRVLSDQEVSYLYNNGAGIQPVLSKSKSP